MWVDQSNPRNIQNTPRKKSNKSVFSLFGIVNGKREGPTMNIENTVKMLNDYAKESASVSNLNDNENTTNADNGNNKTTARRNSNAQSIFSVETRPTTSKLNLFSSVKRINSKQAQQLAAYCDYGLLAFDINNFKQQKFDMKDVFTANNETIEHFTTNEKRIYNLLLMCIEKIIMTNAFTNQEKQILRRNLYNSHYYITISVNNKTYKLSDENISRYLRHCCRKHVVPYFVVHSLSALTRK